MRKLPMGEMEKQELERALIGHVWVDSGQLVVTDPIYLEELDAEMLGALTNLNERAVLVNEGMAAALRSGLRNAKYPVYVTKFRNGALAKVEIVFDERV